MRGKSNRLIRLRSTGGAAILMLLLLWGAQAWAGVPTRPSALPPQDTGFLNRSVTIRGVPYRFQVYLPQEWRRDDHKQWPIILFLHGRGERGSEGMWQTQIGLPQQLRDHPERWPFIVVMPQCPLGGFWTDPEELLLAMTTLDMEAAEFHADPDRTYLMGISLGGYAAWELARLHPHRWAAVAIAASGIFWSYAPSRRKEQSTMPGEYARAVGKLPIWMFHGTEDSVVSPKQSERMLEALKSEGGHVKLWLYQGLKHDCWTRAFNETELPRWLLAHRGGAKPDPAPMVWTERIVIPPHPPAIKLPPALLDNYTGDYVESKGMMQLAIYRQGDQLFQKNGQGEVVELAPESTSIFFFPNGGQARIIFQRDAQGRVSGLTYRDDRHEEHWELVRSAASNR